MNKLVCLILICFSIGIVGCNDAYLCGDSENYCPNFDSVKMELLPVQVVVSNPILTSEDVTDVKAEFVADPFLFKDENEWLMFFEVYNEDSEQGDIGLARSLDGSNWKYDSIVLDEMFHLSYPLVFKFDGEYYMVPETHEVEEVRLYVADNFPYDWKFKATLLSGKMADASIFYYNNMWWMFVSTNNGTLNLYYSKNLSYGWEAHPKTPLISNDYTVARPAGRPLVFSDGRLLRFAQDDFEIYGKAVKAFEVDNITDTEYAEHLVGVVFEADSGGGEAWNSIGMHAIDAWWNEDHWLIVTDGKDNKGKWSIGIFKTLGHQINDNEGEKK